MAHQITLTDDEYQRLSAAAAEQGKTIEELVRAALTAQLSPPPSANKPAMTEREFEEHLYRKGIIDHIPDHRPDTPEEEAERERLARSFGPGTPLSEIVIEDRGPR